MLNILIPYFNRPENKAKLDKVLNQLDKTRFNIIYCEDLKNGEFNSGYCLNKVIKKAPRGWFLKNDVDCIGFLSLYDYVYDKIKHMKWDDYLILGAVYCDRNGKSINKKINCGNEIVFSKDAWNESGQIPEFKGYGYEDYLYAYRIIKNKYPHFKLSEYKIETIAETIRDEIVRPENLKHPFFKHLHHEPQDFSSLQVNRKRLFFEIMEAEL